MNKIFGYISLTLGIVVLVLALTVGRATESADTVKFVGGTTYRLAGSGVTNSTDTITLTSFTIPQTGQKLTMNDFGTRLYGTIEPGNITKQEFVSCTGITQNANGTATLTGCSRGMAPISPYTASTTLRFSHAGGSTFVISNPPQLYDLALFKDNNATSTGWHVWASTTPPGYDFVPPNHRSGAIVSTTSEFASMAALNAVVAAGALDASEGNQGIVELATQIEAASSTENGSQAKLVLQAKYSTSTCGILGLYSIITANDGKITNTCIDQTENYTWSGTHSFSGAVTHNATTTQAGRVIPSSSPTFGSYGGGYLPTGTILTYASSTPPDGFLACNGAAVSRSTYGMLFGVVGTTYGVGDGSTTFNVPDARGRNTLYASSTTNMAQTGGESNHTMTTAELVAHTHTVTQDVNPSEGGMTETASGDLTPDATGTTGSTGSTAPFNVLDPYFVAFCIIKI